MKHSVLKPTAAPVLIVCHRRAQSEGQWFGCNLYRPALSSCTTTQFPNDLVLVMNIAKALEDTNRENTSAISQFCRNSCFPIFKMSQSSISVWVPVCEGLVKNQLRTFPQVVLFCLLHNIRNPLS